MATDFSGVGVRNAMATDFFASESETLWPPTQIELGLEKRFGHQLFWGPKTLWPPTQFDLGLEKRFGHRLKLSWGPKSALATAQIELGPVKCLVLWLACGYKYCYLSFVICGSGSVVLVLFRRCMVR